MYFLRGEGGSHNVDIILGGVVTRLLDYKWGRGVKNLGKSDYIIYIKIFLLVCSVFII